MHRFWALKQILTAYGQGSRLQLLGLANNPLLIKDENLTNLSTQITTALVGAGVNAQQAGLMGQVWSDKTCNKCRFNTHGLRESCYPSLSHLSSLVTEHTIRLGNLLCPSVGSHVKPRAFALFLQEYSRVEAGEDLPYWLSSLKLCPYSFIPCSIGKTLHFSQGNHRPRLTVYSSRGFGWPNPRPMPPACLNFGHSSMARPRD